MSFVWKNSTAEKRLTIVITRGGIGGITQEAATQANMVTNGLNNASTVVYLGAGDLVHLQGFQFTGGTLATLYSVNNPVHLSQLAIERIAAA